MDDPAFVVLGSEFGLSYGKNLGLVAGDGIFLGVSIVQEAPYVEGHKGGGGVFGLGVVRVVSFLLTGFAGGHVLVGALGGRGCL